MSGFQLGHQVSPVLDVGIIRIHQLETGEPWPIGTIIRAAPPDFSHEIERIVRIWQLHAKLQERTLENFLFQLHLESVQGNIEGFAAG